MMCGIDQSTGARYGSAMRARLGGKTDQRSARLDRRSGGPTSSAADRPCPHYPHCIGCPFIDVPYTDQLARKRERVASALARYPALAGVEVPAVTAAPHRLRYRTRIKLVVRATRDEIAAGLYVPGTHRVMDISSCAVHPEPVNRVVRYLKRKCAALKIVPYDERSDSGDLRYLDLRYSFARREANVTLVTRHGEFPQGGALARALMRKFSWITGVVQNVNEERGNVIWGDRYKVLAGQDTLLEKIGALTLAYPAGVFSQANPAMAQILYDAVGEMAALNTRQTVLDLYCGVGPIALTLARRARLVSGIDDSSLSIDTAKQNARRHGIGNCRFVYGDVAQKVAEAERSVGRVDCIVVNPPRKGLQPAALAAIIDAGAPRIVYVSCDAASLARDLDQLLEIGYRLGDLKCFDMFPQTDQVETVAALVK
jgi:23S rRNA (uracil1939-C5)-methyltransferase